MPDRPDDTATILEREHSAAAIAVAGLAALAVAMGIGRFAFTPLLPMMQADTGLGLAAGGWLASANYLGYFLGAVSAMGIRVRPAAAIRAGLFTIALTTFAMGLAHDLAAWLVLRALAGAGSAWVLVFVSARCLEKLAAQGRSALNGVVFAGVGAGIAAAGLLCLVLMQLESSSAHAWMTFGVISLALTLAIWPAFGPDVGEPAGGATRLPATGRLANGASLRLVLCYGAFGFGYIIPATFLPVIAKQAMPDPAIFGWSWPVFGLAAMASTLAVATLRNFIGDRRLWIAGHITMALGTALPVFRPGVIAVVIAAVFVGGTFMVVTMAAIQEARAVAGPRAAGLIAAMTAAFAIGQIAGPIGASYAVRATGDFTISLLAACLLLLLSAYALSRRYPESGAGTMDAL